MAFASLTIDLAARLARFEGDMGKMVHVAEREAKRMDRAFSAVSRTLGALGAVVSVGGIVALGRNLIGAAANLDDLAEKTGASVAQLSSLEQQARISGTQIETVETALIRLAKGLNSTDEEAKKAERALGALGLRADELRGKDTAEALRIVADRMNQFADGSGKTALALDLFGRSGAQVLPFLKDLANDQRTASNVTAEQAAKAEELEKSLRRLGNEIRNTAQNIFLDIVPALAKFAEELGEAQKAGFGLLGALFEISRFRLGGGSAQSIIATAQEDLNRLREANELMARMPGYQAAIARNYDAIRDAEKRLELGRALQRREALEGRTGPQFLDARDLKAAQKGILDYTASVEKVGAAVKGTASPFDQMKRQMQEQLAKTGELNTVEATLALLQTDRYAKLLPAQKEELLNLAALIDQRKEATRLYKEDADAFEAFHRRGFEMARNEAERVAGLIEQYTDLVDPVDRFRRQLEEISVLRQRRPDQSELFAKAEVVVRGNMWDAELEALGGKVQAKTDEMTEFFRQAARNMQDAMAEGFFDIMQGKFDNLGDRFKSMIDRMVANLLASQLNNFLFGADFGKGGQMGGVVAAAAKAFGIPGFAVGTPFVPRDMVAVVHRGERIVPAAENRMSGGTSVTVRNYFTISGPTDRRSQNQIAVAAGLGVQRALARDN